MTEIQTTLTTGHHAREQFTAADDREAVLKILDLQATDGGHLTFATGDRDNGEWYRWDGTHHAYTRKAKIGQSIVDTWITELVAASAADQTRLAVTTQLVKVGKRDETLTTEDEQALEAFKTRLGDVQKYRKSVCAAYGRNSLLLALRSACAREEGTFDGERSRQWTVLSDGQVLDNAALERDGSVTLHAPDHRRPVSRKMGARYDRRAQAPTWRAFLDYAVPDVEVQRYLQVCAGAALLGNPSQKRIPHLVGLSNTGKSTYLKALVGVFGGTSENATAETRGGYGGFISPKAISETQGQNFDQDVFRGKRFAAISEPVAGSVDDAFLKSITGGEPVRSGGKGKDFTEYLPECVLHIVANRVINFNTRAEDVAQRIDVVAFDQVHEPRLASAPTTLDQDLAVERDGILLWVIEGARRFAAERIVIPASVLARRATVADDASIPRTWLNEMLVAEGPFREVELGNVQAQTLLPLADAWRLYQDWAADSNERKSGTYTEFSRDLAARLGEHVRSNGTRLRGIVRAFDQVMVEGGLAVDNDA